MASKKYYITTPIYYPSERLHVGHAYTTVLCDAAARWRRRAGEDTLFLTGSDEHGLKILRSAEERGKDPKQYVDEIVATFKELWQQLDIEYDVFLRTTEERHVRVVQELFQRLYDKGDIYKGSYEGWYCTPCETFWREIKEDDQSCPDCDRSLEWVEEESYFFRMSAYAEPLLEHIEAHPEFIQPESRKNEMVSFIRGGLDDLSVTRTTFDWGIRVPFDPDHVIYVWIDALSNYVTGAGWLEDEAAYAKWWPADCHVVGKDILRFHTIIWPTLLLAAGLPLPKSVYGHGWLLTESGKMSKSKGNVIDPHRLIDRFGSDAVRYFLLREMPYGQDARYHTEALIKRINFDLANDLGNAFHRTASMLERFCGGKTPEAAELTSLESDLIALADTTRDRVDAAMRALRAATALEELWVLVRAINKYIDDAEPWRLAKKDDPTRLGTVMAHVIGALRTVALLLAPFLPKTAQAMWERLGLEGDIHVQPFSASRWALLPPGQSVAVGTPLFPRLDIEEVLDQLEAESQALDNDVGETERGAAAVDSDQKGEPDNVITIDDFSKVKLKLARVVGAEKIQGADKLLKLQVDLGTEERQVVAGVAQHYTPDALVGKKVVIVTNLKPITLRGEQSQGMILAAVDGDDRLGIITVEEDLPPGSPVQ